MSSEVPHTSVVVQIKSEGKTVIDLKVSLSALCNRLSIPPKEMQSSLLSVIDPKKKISRVLIQCFKEGSPRFTLLKEHHTRTLKRVYDSFKNGSLSNEEFEEELKKIALDLKESQRFYSKDINSIIRSLRSTIRTFQ